MKGSGLAEGREAARNRASPKESAQRFALSPKLNRHRLTLASLPCHTTVRTGPYTAVRQESTHRASFGRPRELKKVFGSAFVKVGLMLSRHGPCALPAVCAAGRLPIPL